jgi:hypothetical protein
VIPGLSWSLVPALVCLAAEPSARGDRLFRDITVEDVRLEEGWVRVPPDNVLTFTKTWQARAPDLIVTLGARQHGDEINEDQLRSRLWLRLDGRDHRRIGILRAGGVPDLVGLRYTETVNLCEFLPVDTKYPGEAACSGLAYCWTLPKGEHTLQVCVKGGACSVPVTFHWHGAKAPICP